VPLLLCLVMLLHSVMAQLQLLLVHHMVSLPTAIVLLLIMDQTALMQDVISMRTVTLAGQSQSVGGAVLHRLVHRETSILLDVLNGKMLLAIVEFNAVTVESAVAELANVKVNLEVVIALKSTTAQEI